VLVADERTGGMREVFAFAERAPLHPPEVETERARCPLHSTKTGLGGVKAAAGAQEKMRMALETLRELRALTFHH
jgi:hypothetical protein